MFKYILIFTFHDIFIYIFNDIFIHIFRYIFPQLNKVMKGQYKPQGSNTSGLSKSIQGHLIDIMSLDHKITT